MSSSSRRAKNNASACIDDIDPSNAKKAVDVAWSLRTGWPWLIVLFVVALVYRVLALHVIGDHPLLLEPVVDAGQHHAWAERIVAGDWLGQGPDDVFKPPLYPYLLAIVYSVFGPDIRTIQWLQAISGAVSTLLIAQLGGTLLGRRAAVLAGLIAALYAPFVFFELQLLTPSISLLLNVFGLVLLVRAWSSGRRSVLLGAGLIFGLSALARSDMLLPLFLVLLMLLGLDRQLRLGHRLKRIGWIWLGVVLAITPVTIRNFIVTGDLIPVSSNAGINFYVGHVAGDGLHAVPVGIHWERLIARVPQSVLVNPAVASQWWVDQTFGALSEQPAARTLENIGRKLLAFFNAREIRNNIDYQFLQRDHWLLQVPFFQFGLLLPFAALGMVFLVREKRSAGERMALVLCIGWIGGGLLLGLIFFVNARYRIAVMPVLILVAAWGLIRFREMLVRQDWANLRFAGIVVIVVSVVSWPPWLGSTDEDWAHDYINLGNSHRDAGRLAEAQVAYESALRLSPLDPDANYLLGQLWQSRRPDRALPYLETARSVVPDSPDVLLALGLGSMELRRPDRAEDAFEAILDVSRNSNLWPKRSVWARAHLMLATLKPTQADLHREQAWSIDPATTAEASFIAGVDMVRVSEVFRTLAIQKPWSWYDQANYGMALLRMGESDAAVKQLQRAAELAPDSMMLRFHLGRALLLAGELETAGVTLSGLRNDLPGGDLRRRVDRLLAELEARGESAGLDALRPSSP